MLITQQAVSIITEIIAQQAMKIMADVTVLLLWCC